MIEQAITDILETDPAVAALINGRIQPLVVTGLAMPAISYTRLAGDRDRTHQGSNGLVHSRFQIDCWGKSYADAKAVSNAARKALDNFLGLRKGTTITGSELESENDVYEPDQPIDDSELRLYRVSNDYLFWHDED